MNTANLITLTLIYSLALLIFQRTERKRLWLSALLLVLPVSAITWYWASYEEQEGVALAAAGIALAFNGLFWLIYGRRHPPGSSDDITVSGME